VTADRIPTIELRGTSVLFLVENLSVPFDRRVWAECRSLRAAGCDVTVICPRGTDSDAAAHEVREGIVIHRYRPRPASGGSFSYLREYGSALRQIHRLIRRLAKTQRFDVVHACNPPDLLLLAALPLRRTGTHFVFDHHDLAPELYLSRFGRGPDPVHQVLLACERLSFRLADVVLATNESYRDVAVCRGRKRAEDVFVVRNGPDLGRFTPTAADPAVKHGKKHLIAYVGMMGPQDGIDHALRALEIVKRQRTDWHAVFVGGGDVLDAMRLQARELGLANDVTFTGLVEQERVVRVLSTADVCLSPEPASPLNDVSTMMKVAEYMAMKRPVVAFDLRETRATAGQAALYAPPNDESAYATHIADLLADPQLRGELGKRGRRRVERELSWERSEERLLAAYEHVLADAAAPLARQAVVGAAAT
jgi:glycosyltransferase involved in cell wall biosynthesis